MEKKKDKKIDKRFKTDPFVRINTRITSEQHKFAKSEAKKRNIPEGAMHRIMLDYYLAHHK